MLLIDIFRYLKKRADRRPIYLKNFVDQTHHHGSRISDPSVAIIIPTRDKVELLRACVESIFDKTRYANYEVIIVDNQSVEFATLDYFDELGNRCVRILKHPHKFNYSAICNEAARIADTDILCFLNNDVEIADPNWLNCLVDHASNSSVGVTGALMLYPDGAIQHAGVALGISGVASNIKLPLATDFKGGGSCFEVSAVTFACAAIKKNDFIALNGLDETFRVGLNDVDVCIRANNVLGKNNVLCQQTHLIHIESQTRGKTFGFASFITASFEVIRFLSLHPVFRMEKFFAKRFD